ncbi:hypothetical protein SYN65AY6LI_03715 [Synechococcus sp. 65AY6Li]|uniref:hypothetical protein n=1 Tax=unclassified Synechococcus TaxID=2626047 RepID=UPI0000693F5F|nr:MULTISPECIES: hypothetical protein [unclassified Synechococcus]ABC98416.1 conserved hypothetical protein [Synechococcus sp. JA-3-3Ab]PIK91436.1 hypothetical protein SYN65AY6LI_03715 [Synechococcus sp. 65AY6Li]
MSKFKRLLDRQPEGIPARPAPKKLSTQAYKIPEPPEAGAKPNSSEYVKLTAYISKETHRAVKRLLLESDQDLSELIEALLAQWLRSQSAKAWPSEDPLSSRGLASGGADQPR